MKLLHRCFLLCLLIITTVSIAEVKALSEDRSLVEVFVPDAVDFKEAEVSYKSQLRKLSVSIRNRDRKVWNGIKVVFIFPSGRKLVAQGVNSIQPGRQSAYSLNKTQLESVRGEWIGTETNFLSPKIEVSHLISKGQD